MLREEGTTQLDRIAGGRLRELVEEGFRRVRGVGASDGTPPQHRHADVGRVQLHADGRHGVRKIRRALHGRLIHAVLHQRRLERRSSHDRLADDAVLPGDHVALGVEPGAQPMHVERSIAAALDVVLARPHQLDGAIAADGLGDAGRLAGHVAVRGCAAAEAATREQRVDANGGRRHADDPRNGLLIEGGGLRAGPEIDAVAADADDRVQRFHRRVRQIREFVHRFQDSGRAAQRAVDIALAPRRSPRTSGEHAICRVELVGAARLRAALVPRHAQGLAPLARGPEAGGHDGDARRHRHDVGDAVHAARGRRVEGLHGGAEARRPCDERGEHPRQREVQRELRRPVGLRLAVDSTEFFADELEVLGILQRDLGRRCEGRRLRRQLAERRSSSRRRVRHNAAVHGDLGRRHAPLARGRFHEHGARRGAGAAHLLPRVGHGRAAAGELHGTECQIVVPLGIGGGRLHADLQPVRVQLLGEDGREPGVAALAHLDVLADDRDGVVRRDADEGVGRENVVGGGGRAVVESEGDEERGAGERGGLEEATACQHAQPPSVLAASWIAARMRT